MNNKIIISLIKLINKQKKFLIGFSGGIDSTVLLHALYTINKQYSQISIRAIHINHYFNKNSTKIAVHCKTICNQWKIHLIQEHINLSFDSNKESLYRKKRYDLYKKYLLPNEIILTAHHQNDQCETLLLSLKRGSGLKGLAGIHKYIFIKDKLIIVRPFLYIPKYIINMYAIKNKLKWIEDISNNNINFDRNFLRCSILPQIINKWPSFIKTTTRCSKICYQQNKLITLLIDNLIPTNYFKKKKISLIPIINLQKEIQIYILKKWINEYISINISYKWIHILWNNIFMKKKINKYYKICINKYFIIWYKNYLYLTKNIQWYKETSFIWDKKKTKFVLPYQLGFLKWYKSNNNLYNIRKPYKHEIIYVKFNIQQKITILNKNIQRIKNIWQSYNIKPWNRKLTPIVYYNELPIVCPNLFITKESQIYNFKLNYTIKWYKNNLIN